MQRTVGIEAAACRRGEERINDAAHRSYYYCGLTMRTVVIEAAACRRDEERLQLGLVRAARRAAAAAVRVDLSASLPANARDWHGPFGARPLRTARAELGPPG